MNLILKISHIIDSINERIGKLLYPSILLMAILILWEVLMRYIFNRPTLWVQEATQLLFAVCSLLAGAHIEKEKSHINVDILYSHFSPKIKTFSKIVTFPFFLLFTGAMAYFGFNFGFESLMKFERSDSAWSPPIYPIKILLPIGALLLLVQGSLNFIKEIYNNKFKM